MGNNDECLSRRKGDKQKITTLVGRPLSGTDLQGCNELRITPRMASYSLTYPPLVDCSSPGSQVSALTPSARKQGRSSLGEQCVNCRSFPWTNTKILTQSKPWIEKLALAANARDSKRPEDKIPTSSRHAIRELAPQF